MLASHNEEYKKFMSSPPTSATGVPNNSSSSKSSADQKSSQPHIPLIKPPKVKVEWSTGLCDCFSDIPNCCVTCWCPCITFGRISEIVDKGSSCKYTRFADIHNLIPLCYKSVRVDVAEVGGKESLREDRRLEEREVDI